MDCWASYTLFWRQNSGQAIIVTTEIHRIEMEHVDPDLAAAQSSSRGSSAETRPETPFSEGDANLEDEDIVYRQQVSRSHDDLYDSLNGTLVYEDESHEVVEGLSKEQQLQLGTTYTLDAEPQDFIAQEPWEACHSASQENSLPESQERSHPESWSMSQPDLHDTGYPESTGISQSDSGEMSQSESHVTSQPSLRSKSWLDSRGTSQQLSRGKCQLSSRSRSQQDSGGMSQSTSRGRNQLHSRDASQPYLRGRSQLDSRERSQPHSRGLSQLGSSGVSRCQSCSGDSAESSSYVEPVITVVESDLDTVMGEGDNVQVDSRKSKKVWVPHDGQYAREDHIPALQCYDDAPCEGDSVYYDGCQYTLFGDNIECEGTSTGTGENIDIGASLADDNESELERLTYDEDDDGCYDENEKPVKDEKNYEEICSRGYHLEQEDCSKRSNLEGAEEEEYEEAHDEEEFAADETKIHRISNHSIPSEISEVDDNLYHSKRGYKKCTGRLKKRKRCKEQINEYRYENSPKKSATSLEIQSPPEKEKSEIEFTNNLLSNEAMSCGFINDNIHETRRSSNTRQYDDNVVEEQCCLLRNPSSESGHVILNQELNNQNPHLLSQVALEDDSFTVRSDYRSQTTLSSKSSTRSGRIKSVDKNRQLNKSSDGRNKQKGSSASSRRLVSSREQNSSVDSAIVPDACVENDASGQKPSYTDTERKSEARLPIRMDIPISPRHDSALSNEDSETNTVNTVQLKSKLNNFKPISVDKSSQLFVMRGVQVCDASTLQPHPSVQIRSQSRDASYEDTSDSAPERGRPEKQSILDDHTYLPSGQRKHRLSCTERNKRRSGETTCAALENHVSTESKIAQVSNKYGSHVVEDTNSESDIEKNRLSPVEQVRKFCPASRRKHCEDISALLQNVVYHGVPLAPDLPENDTTVKSLNPKTQKSNEAEHKQKNKLNSHSEQALLSQNLKHQKCSGNPAPNPSKENVRKQLFKNDDQHMASKDSCRNNVLTFTSNGGGEPGMSESSQQQRAPSTTTASSLGTNNKKINFVDQNRRQLSRGGAKKSYREIFLAKKTKEKNSPSLQSERDKSDISEVEGRMPEDDSFVPRSSHITSHHLRSRAWSDQSSFSSHGEENADSRFNDSPPHSPSPSTEESASGGDNFAPRLTSRPQMPRPTVKSRHINSGYISKVRSVILDDTNSKSFPICRYSDSEESKTEIREKSSRESPAVGPIMSQKNLSDHIEKARDKPKLPRPSRLPVLRAPRPPPRPPPSPPELSPVPPAPMLSPTASDHDEVCSHNSQADSVDSGGDKSKYKPYTIKDYRSLRTETKMGGLGPHRNQALIQDKLQKYQRQAQYAQQVADRNKKLLFARLEKPKCSYVQLAQEAEKQNKASCRQKGIDYARTVSRPPGRGKDPQLDETSSKSDCSNRGKRPAAGKDSNKGVKLPPLTNAAVTNKGIKETEPLDVSSDGTKFDDSLEMSTSEDPHPGAAMHPRKTTENVIETLMDTSAVDKLRQRHEQEKAMVKQLCEKGEGSRTSLKNTAIPK